MSALPEPGDYDEDDGPDEIEQLCRNALVNLDDGDIEEARSAAMQATMWRVPAGSRVRSILSERAN